MSAPDKLPSQALTEARDLIARPGGWTQCVFARNERGRMVDYYSDSAVCFCSEGALHRVGATYRALSFLEAVIDHQFYSIVDFNDAPDRTQAEVVDKLDAAAALARSEGQ